MPWPVPDPLLRDISAAGRNFYAIDFFRGVAALCIVIFHFKNFALAGGAISRPLSALDDIVLLRWLEPLRTHGSLAVMAFWTISGFVFASVYVGKQPDAFGFFVRRMARLYPLHALTLVVMAILQIVALGALGQALIFQENDVGNFVLHIFFASDWGLEHGRSFNYPVWSVSAEILIYAAFWALLRIRLNLLRLVAIWLLFLVAAFSGWADNVLACGVFFFGGAITYAVYRIWPPERSRTLIGCAALVFMAGLIAAMILPAYFPTTFWLLPTIGALLLLLVCAEHLWFGRLFRSTKPIGDITYSSYLWHSPIQVVILLGTGLGFWSLDSLFTDAFFIFYLLLVCTVSMASFCWIERPAQRWVLARFASPYPRKLLISAP